MFSPKTVSEDIWRRVKGKVDEISSCEVVEHDICLIGSHAREDASKISDIDLVMFCDGESNLKGTKFIYLDGKPVTIFPVNVKKLIGAESIEFYNANNPFEAKLVHGDGKVLNKLRNAIFRKKIDLDSTKKMVGRTVSLRLMSSLSDAILDYGEGIRNMRVCMMKTKLYKKLFFEKVDPWSIIPYRYEPEDEFEKMLNKLYLSESYDELSSRIRELKLKKYFEETFGKNFKAMNKIAERMIGEMRFAGEHVENYIHLYLIVEERVRSRIWRKLFGRWKLDERFKSSVNHDRTNIACQDNSVSWIVSIGKGESFKLEAYGKTEF
ncbi:MAG TPA: hypothetical protein EYP68_03195 [Candidatus Korarchaeota archaeon]|nr:hypothetical protein [Candidatus Korarchaeota archaeon]